MQRRLLFVLFFLSNTSIFIFAQEVAFAENKSHAPQQTSDNISMTRALSTLSDKYDIYFSYDVAVLNNYAISKNKLKGDGFENDLKTLLIDTDLKYKKIGKNNYVIFKAAKKRNNKKRIDRKKNTKEKENKIEKLSQRSSNISPSSLNKPKINILDIEAFPVRGIVLDETGQPMIGVVVVLKNDPGVGTITEIDGSFSLDIPNENETLVFTYVGYQILEVEGRCCIKILCFDCKYRILYCEKLKKIENNIKFCQGCKKLQFNYI